MVFPATRTIIGRIVFKILMVVISKDKQEAPNITTKKLGSSKEQEKRNVKKITEPRKFRVIIAVRVATS